MIDLKDLKEDDILVKPGFYFNSFVKVKKILPKSVTLVHLDSISKESITTEMICTLIVKPGNEEGTGPFKVKSLEEYDLYDPSRVYYDVIVLRKSINEFHLVLLCRRMI